MAVCNISVATTHSYLKKDTNERIEDVTWHRIVIWGTSAENCNLYLNKGSKVHVFGRIKTNKYTDKDGKERQTNDIIAERVNFLDSRKKDQGSPQGQAQAQPQKTRPSGRPQEDDIPF
jgi:single-strand DNA-binding protein